MISLPKYNTSIVSSELINEAYRSKNEDFLIECINKNHEAMYLTICKNPNITEKIIEVIESNIKMVKEAKFIWSKLVANPNFSNEKKMQFLLEDPKNLERLALIAKTKIDQKLYDYIFNNIWEYSNEKKYDPRSLKYLSKTEFFTLDHAQKLYEHSNYSYKVIALASKFYSTKDIIQKLLSYNEEERYKLSKTIIPHKDEIDEEYMKWIFSFEDMSMNFSLIKKMYDADMVLPFEPKEYLINTIIEKKLLEIEEVNKFLPDVVYVSFFGSKIFDPRDLPLINKVLASLQKEIVIDYKQLSFKLYETLLRYPQTDSALLWAIENHLKKSSNQSNQVANLLHRVYKHANYTKSAGGILEAFNKAQDES